MSAADEQPGMSIADDYLDLWDQSEKPPELASFLSNYTELNVRDLTDVLLIDQSSRWQTGQGQPVEVYLEQYPQIARDRECSLDLIYGEFRNAPTANPAELSHDLQNRFPQWKEELARQFDVARWIEEIDLSEIQTEYDSDVLREDFPLSDLETAAPLPFSDYQLEEQLGAGAMGTVYKATQKSLGKTVAIKILGDIGKGDRELTERFFREARMVASLHHPHIVDVHGLGRTDDDSYFLVMDYIDGKNLHELTRSGRLSVEEATRITSTVARALDHAHSRGIVHRDIKPGNVLLDGTGQVQVTDFGLSRELDASGPEMSTADQIIGTPQYMAPEQGDRELGPIDARTDVYGLGGLLFALLTGEPPITGNNKMQVIAKLLSPEPVRSPRALVPELPIALEQICLKCLQKDPADRFHSAREVEEALLGATSVESTKPPAKGTQAARPSNWSNTWIWVIAGLAVLLTGIAFLADGFRSEDGQHIVSSTGEGTKVKWELTAYREGKETEKVDLLKTPVALNNGDHLQMRIGWAQKKFAYLLWVGSDQSLQVLYAPPDETTSVTELTIPADSLTGLPLTGPTGAELGVLILRDKPIESIAALKQRFEPVPEFGDLEEIALIVDGMPFTAADLDPEHQQIANSLDQSPARPLGDAQQLKTTPARAEIQKWIKQIPDDVGEVSYVVLQHGAGK